MTQDELKKKVRDALKSGPFNDPSDLVDVSDAGIDGCIHVVVVSRKFDSLGRRGMDDLISSELEKLGPEVAERVTLFNGASPEWLKAGVW